MWSAGKLADDNFDEFTFSSYLTPGLKPDTMLYFPWCRKCEQGLAAGSIFPGRPERPWA